MKIVSSKQVGPIYYMVNTVEVLVSICNYNAISTSLKAEPRSNGGGKYHYVSFMRDLTKADRNISRWRYGVKIDGDKLSNRYSISPYSFAGNALSKGYYKVKTLTSYDDGTYTLSLVNWPTIQISAEMFKEIQSIIESDIQGVNDSSRLEISEGKRAYRGRTAITRYNYDVKHGGAVLSDKTASSHLLQYLIKHTGLNETEERIWIFNNAKYIDVSGCILGFIEPKGDSSVEEAILEGLLPDLKISKF